MDIKKTSEEWSKDYKDRVEVMDPDGWDRKNFEYSWYSEMITQNEFEYRLTVSTCIWNLDHLKDIGK